MAGNTAPDPCPTCGGEMWDNRENKRNPKQPDYRCKDRSNCEGAVWLKKPKETPKAAAATKATSKEAHSAGPHIPGIDGAAPAPAPAATAPQPAGTAADLANLLRVHRAVALKVAGYAAGPLQKAGGDSAGAYAAMVNSIFIEACRRRIVLPPNEEAQT